MAEAWEFACAPRRGVTTQPLRAIGSSSSFSLEFTLRLPATPTPTLRSLVEWLGLHPGFIVYWLCGLGKAVSLSVSRPPTSQDCGSVCLAQQHLAQNLPLARVGCFYHPSGSKVDLEQVEIFADLESYYLTTPHFVREDTETEKVRTPTLLS